MAVKFTMNGNGPINVRVTKTDRELFPATKFNWDMKRYKEDLDQQVELNKLKKQLNKARERVFEGTLLAEDRRQTNLNQSVRKENLENLRKSFYSAVKPLDHAYDSFIHQGKEELPAQDLPSKRDHIKFNMTGYAENDDDIVRKQKEANRDQLTMQMHNSRLSKGRDTLNELNDEIDDLNKLDNQRFQDAGMKTNQFSRRTAPNSARPRTPVEDSNNPFDRMKLEEELAKYKRYLKFELPDIVTKQVNDIFEREETGLKSLMSERDQLLKMQLNSFHEYLSIMDQSRVRELSDMNNLKLEVDGLKRANDVRVSTVHRALNETDQMLADEIEWKRIANSYRPATFYQTDENLKPYSLDTNDMWNEGKYLRGVSSNVDIRRDLNHDKSAIRRVHSSMVGLSPDAGAYNDINESDTARKSRIDDIIHELDHLMDDMNNPGYYKLPKNSTFTN